MLRPVVLCMSLLASVAALTCPDGRVTQEGSTCCLNASGVYSSCPLPHVSWVVPSLENQHHRHRRPSLMSSVLTPPRAFSQWFYIQRSQYCFYHPVPGNCSFLKAVCCEDHVHCCSESTTCDLEHNKCINATESLAMVKRVPVRLMLKVWGCQRSLAARML